MKHYFLTLTFCLICLISVGQKRSKTGNPFLDKKKRQSELQRQQDAAIIAKGNKAYEGQLDKAEKKFFPGRKKVQRGGIGKTPAKKGKRRKERI